MIIVVIGVAGSGKTTVGTLLADAMHCPFLEGDSLHSNENIDKMSHGIPLTDADRAPWLAAIHARILDWFERGQDLVVGCSALKQRYRDGARRRRPDHLGVFERSFELIRSRLRQRSNHFMKADMLASQFDALEEPSERTRRRCISATGRHRGTNPVASCASIRGRAPRKCERAERETRRACIC